MEIPDSTRLTFNSESGPTRSDVARQPAAVDQTTQKAPQASPPQKAPPKVEAPEPPEYARAPEVAEIAARLREISEIRSDVISAVRKLLNAGRYRTREAAEETAKKLLGPS